MKTSFAPQNVNQGMVMMNCVLSDLIWGVTMKTCVLPGLVGGWERAEKWILLSTPEVIGDGVGEEMKMKTVVVHDVMRGWVKGSKYRPLTLLRKWRMGKGMAIEICFSRRNSAKGMNRKTFVSPDPLGYKEGDGNKDPVCHSWRNWGWGRRQQWRRLPSGRKSRIGKKTNIGLPDA